jgi:tryptophanyl-tRNA synthetase
VVLKKYLIEVLENFLSPIREQRAIFAQQKHEVKAMLLEGTARTRSVVQETMREVKSAMKLIYF